MKRFFILFIAAQSLAVFTTSAIAQSSSRIDRANIAAVCATSHSACEALIASAISDLEAAGLTETELGTELGIIASSVVEAAQKAPEQAVELSSVLETIADSAPTSAQASSIRTVANTVGSGGGGGIDITRAIGSSPA